MLISFPSQIFFLSDLLAIWQPASNKKTNQEELDEQQLQVFSSFQINFETIATELQI